MTEHGPAIEVHRSVLGFRFKASDAAFAAVATRHIDMMTTLHAGAQAMLARQRAAAAPKALPIAAAAQPQVLSVTRRLAKQAMVAQRKYAQVPAQPSFSARPATPARAQAAKPEAAAPSAGWTAHCDRMTSNIEWATTPEVQTTAYMLGSRVRVFMQQADGTYAVHFTANPLGERQPLDVVLQGNHYNYIAGGVRGDSFTDSDPVAQQRRNVEPDGNCFFHCATQGLTHAGVSAPSLRAAVVAKLRTSENVAIDGGDGLTFGQAFA